MTNKGTYTPPRFQLSLLEIHAIVLLTVFVTGLANYGSRMSIEDRLPFLLSVTIPTAGIIVLVLWLIKTRRWGYFISGFIVTPILLAVILPPMSTPRSVVNTWTASSTCQAFAEAQEIYRRTDWDRDGVLEYAVDIQQLIDREQPGDELIALIDRGMANADARLMTPTPKAGYLFKILRARMLGGSRETYFEGENMTRGYAFLAFPVQYGVSGFDSFIIDSSGRIYQKDLGPNTVAVVQSIFTLDVGPGSGWVTPE